MTEARDVLGVVATRVPLLVLRLGSSFFRLLFGNRRAAASFRRALRKNGLGRRRARELATRYRHQTDVFRIIRRVVREARWERGGGPS